VEKYSELPQYTNVTFRKLRRVFWLRAKRHFLGVRFGILFFSGRLKELTLTLLKDLKQAAENRKDNGTKD
jgi:hypothetical protein